jgi:hypothetical protein
MYFLSEKPKHILLEKILAWSGYLLFILTTGIIGTLIILYYSGYSFSKSGGITRTGFITISSNPVKASVFLDGKQLKGQTYMRLDIPVGTHSFVVRANGYQEWTRDITVEASGIYWLDYIILYPKNLTPYILQNLPSYQQIIPLRGQDKLLGYKSDPSSIDISLIDVKDRGSDNVKLNHFELKDLSLKPDDKITSLEIMKVDRTKKSVILKLNTESGTKLLFYDTEKPKSILNLSEKYLISTEDVGFTYSDYSQLYYIDSANSLRVLNLKTDSISKPLISKNDASDFIVNNQDTIYYTDALNRLFIKRYSSNEPQMISELPGGSGPHKISLASYNSKDYILDYAPSETNQNNSNFNIWSVSDNKLMNEFSVELDGALDNVAASKDDKAIFAITKKGDVASFILEDKVSGHFKLNDFKSDANWAGNHQLSYMGTDGLHLVDFTGDNNKLVSPGSNKSSYIVASDFGNIYYTQKSQSSDAEDSTELNAIDMIIN